MSKKRKKKKVKKVITNNTKEKKEPKKILDGVDLVNKEDLNKSEIKENLKVEKIEEKTKINLNEHIQTFISILFTIIIFIALILLIMILYNNYFKKEEKLKCDELEVCKNYIKKDYGIREEEVNNFIKNLRGIIYNIENFNNKTIENNDLLNFATYFIWRSEGEYLICDHNTDSNCLISKKEMEFGELENYFQKYLDIKDIKIDFNNNFQEEDKTRIYRLDNKVVVSFSEFEYETLKHDIVNIEIDEDKVSVIFALSKRIPGSDFYSYTGYKNLELKYNDNRFIIENIETSLS